jgi:hypothetical protein
MVIGSTLVLLSALKSFCLKRAHMLEIRSIDSSVRMGVQVFLQ